jgi:hypothetical protein
MDAADGAATSRHCRGEESSGREGRSRRRGRRPPPSNNAARRLTKQGKEGLYSNGNYGKHSLEGTTVSILRFELKNNTRHVFQSLR